MTTPHDYVPAGPVETAPLVGYCRPEIRRKAFAAVLEGGELGAYDERIILWLADWDDPTCRTVASQLWRCRLAGAAAASRSRMATAGRDERDHAIAACEPGDCDDLIEDDETSTCSTCGAWIGMFTGRAGWQHYRAIRWRSMTPATRPRSPPEQDEAAR